ncbi:MAG: photosystem II biosynthesis protein [cyanobacterium endosymbiont of Rhopalodia sterrenbergii]
MFTALGISSFFVFYWLVSYNRLDILTVVFGAVSLGFLGLRVLVLSCSIFKSTS